MLSKTITLTQQNHRGALQLFMHFDFDLDLIKIAKSLGARWSQTNNAWYVPHSKEVVHIVFEAFKDEAWVDYEALKNPTNAGAGGRNSPKATLKTLRKERPSKVFSPEIKEEIRRFIHVLGSRGYAQNTRATYQNMIEVLFGYFGNKKPEEITNDDINEFLNEMNVGRGYSASYLRQMVGAIKLFYDKRKGVQLNIAKLDLPKKRRQLPKVLSLEEIGMILDNLKNLKHRTMISLQYGCGLRVGELLNLKVEHIDKDRHTLMVLNGKGRVDRRVKVSDSLLDLLRDYYRAYRPDGYLFEGQNGGRYSDSSVNKLLQNAARNVGIRRHVSSHMLRHSYATHLLEGGVDLRYIQELLGHKSSKTTEIYTYVSTKKLESLPSPFDFLKRNETK